MEKSKVKGMVEDIGLNKNIGSFSYWIHRLTGIGLSIYLIMHTYVLSSAIHSPEEFNQRMGQVQNPFFAILEVFLIAGIFFHMLNGIRVTISDFFGMSRSHKGLFWLVIILFVALMALALYLQIPKFSPEHYGMGGLNHVL